MDYFQITIRVPDETVKDILVALLGEWGYEGFEEQPGVLHAFIPKARFDPTALNGLLAGRQLGYSKELLPKKNWNEEWEKNFHPVVVGRFCAVRANFHSPVGGVLHELVITPKMSFGTGHHATTYMMMEAMQGIDFRGKSVLDFGTGTGLLAILADRLGAARVLAIDLDDWSIENAMENIAENRSRNIVVIKMETIPANELFSIILANINKSVILHELDAMRQHLATDGVILLSGLLQDDAEEIEKKAALCKLTISYNGRITKGNWICLRLETRNK